jgi:RNA-binding protein
LHELRKRQQRPDLAFERGPHRASDRLARPVEFRGCEGPSQAGRSRFRFVASPVLKVPPEGSFQTARNSPGGLRFRVQTAVLTGKQRRHLRSLGHELKPIVQIGRAGIDDGVVAAVDQALADHELVKIKLGEAAALDRHDAAEAIARQTGSEVAQVLGNTLLLYRADPDDPGIVLP